MRIAAILIAILILGWLVFPKPKNPYGRETIVVAGNPVTVLSLDRGKNLTVITLPSSVAAEGTHGYGTYTLDAFWKLGEIDKKDGVVLAESISEALGIPVSWYIGVANANPFSIPGIIGYVGRRYRTNIPFGTFVRLAWLFDVTKPRRVQTYDFTSASSLVAQEQTLPDGSVQSVISPARVDVRLARIFEDDRVRSERVSVAIFNTTDMASLGSRAARLLTNIGVSVVVIGNDSPQVGDCVLTGQQAAISGISAKIIAAVMGCKPVVGVTSRADLEVRIGKTYAARFMPTH